MRIRLVAAIFALAVAGCGTPVSSRPPTGFVQAATATPATTPRTEAIEAIVAWVLDDDAPYFDLVLESIAPTGVSRPLATLRDIHPAGWPDASPRLDAPILVSPQGWVFVSVDRDGGGAADLERTLLLRLDAAGRAPIELPGVAERAAWGPTGELAVFGSRPKVIDPATGQATNVLVPAGVDLLEAWAADGSGWLAARPNGDTGQTAGIIHRDGTFVPGVAQAYGLTGRERQTGADGQFVGDAVSDGADGADTAIVDFGPGICPKCVVWATFHSPGEGPRFNDFIWDAAGTGLWITWQAGDRKTGWLGHSASPGIDRRVVDLPARVDLDIVGISPTDAWLILSAGEQRRLIIADTLTSTTRLIAQPLVPGGPAPIFAGWSSVPAR